MPTNFKQRTASQQSRKSINRRADSKRQRCQGSNGCQKADSKTIANSIFALTLKPKVAIEVIQKKELRGSLSNEDADLEKMYYDLLRIFQHAVKIVRNEETTADVYLSGMSIEESLGFVASAFENNIVPEDCGFNIDHDDNIGYHFTIYKEVDEIGHWVTFEIKPIVEHLWKTNRKLHDLFLILINTFSASTGISSWYSGALSYADDFLEEKVLNYWEEYDESYNDGDTNEETLLRIASERQEAINTIEDYKNGNAAWYKNAIQTAGYIEPEEMLKKLSRFNQDNPVVIWMIDICKFMEYPGSMSEFIYESVESEYYDNGGVRWEEQVSILWNIHDQYTATQEEYLDSESQGCGIVPPVLNMPITLHSKEINLENFIKKSEWVDHLECLEKSHSKLIEILKTI